MYFFILAGICLAPLTLRAQLGNLGSLANKVGAASPSSGTATGAGLSSGTIGDGLKQALQIGTQNTVNLTGKPGGYFNNPAIKILLPKNLSLAEKGMRAAGQGPRVDDFILSMNSAAEAAAPAAKKIFIDAITGMSIDDARKILTGGDTAATDYFKNKTTTQLTAAFHPQVEKAMAANGTTQKYNQLAAQAKSIPFMGSRDLDITDYVVSKALDGLFLVLGQEEKKIRTDPAAQTTSLLKQVFGK